MTGWQVVHHVGKQLEPDQKAVQGILVQVLRQLEQVVQNLGIGLDVALDEGQCQFVLVPEVIEEAALGNAGLLDLLFNRGRAEAFFQYRGLGYTQNAFAGFLTFSHDSNVLIFENLLYQW